MRGADGVRKARRVCTPYELVVAVLLGTMQKDTPGGKQTCESVLCWHLAVGVRPRTATAWWARLGPPWRIGYYR